MDFARAEGTFLGEFARSENSNLHDLSEKFARAPTGRPPNLRVGFSVSNQNFWGEILFI
jgi:hypothetical protein